MKKTQIQGNAGIQPQPFVPASKTDRIGIWMPLIIADIARDTLGFPLEFYAMYLKLMTAMWQNNGQLRDNEDYLRRVSGATAAQWIQHRQDIANLFVPGDGSWTHNGIREQLARAGAVSESRRSAGKIAINTRWAREREAKKVVDSVLEKIKQDGSAY